MEYLTNDTELTLVADAIRNLGGTTASISYPFGWVNALSNIEPWRYGECGDIQGSISSATGLASRTTLASNTFRGNKSITFASFPRVSTMSYTAFSGCTNLKAVILKSVTTIPNRAFAGCTALEYAEFPACTSIDALGSTSTVSTSHPFYSCSNFYLSIPAYSTTITDVNFAGIEIKGITAGCTTIASSAFRSKSHLMSVNFPSCTQMGDSVFANCSSLITANFSKCLSVGNTAFGFCYSLTTARFPMCSLIKSYAFYKCSSLRAIDFPMCTSVYNDAFLGCYSVSTINLPLCKFIGIGAFYHLNYLTTLILPACTSIYSDAFGACKALTTVSLPACEFLGSSVFYSCSALMSVYLLNPSMTTLISPYVFYQTPMWDSSYTGSFGSIYVPASLLTAYQTATNWASFSSRFVGLTDEEIAALS